MSSGVKIKPHDEMYSMFLVPKRLYYSLIKNTEDDESKKELISMNEKPETTNYIENAIKFKNLQDRQKIIQTGDKLLRFGSDKLPNVTSIAQSDSMGRTYQSLSRSPSTQIPQREEIQNVMSPGRVTQKGSSIDRAYHPVSRSPSTQITQREEIPNALTPARIDTSMDLTDVSLYRTPTEIPQQEENNLPSTPIIERQSDAEKSLSPEKTKSPNESAYSTPVGTQREEWRETPVLEAMTKRNSRGKLVCPVPDCWKQYVDEGQLGKHLLKDHPKDIALKDKKTIKGMISSPYARTNSSNEMDYSYALSAIKSPVVLKWRNTPIAKAVKEKNAAGKIVCPFPNCGKQYVGIPQFAKHMMKDHYKELSVRDQNKIFGMTSTPRKRRLRGIGSSSPSFPLTPVKIRFSAGKAQSKGATKRNSADANMTPAQTKTRSKSMKMFQSRSPTKRDPIEAGMSPAKTRSKTRKMSKSEAKADSVKKLFSGKYPKL